MDKSALDKHITGNYGEDELTNYGCVECGSDNLEELNGHRGCKPIQYIFCHDCGHRETVIDLTPPTEEK